MDKTREDTLKEAFKLASARTSGRSGSALMLEGMAMLREELERAAPRVPETPPQEPHPFTRHKLLILLDECRDAIQPLTTVQTRLHNISLTLAKRIDDVIDKSNAYNAATRKPEITKAQAEDIVRLTQEDR